jgi:hypothetical protein
MVRQIVAQEVDAALTGVSRLEPRVNAGTVQPPELRRRVFAAVRSGALRGEQIGRALFVRLSDLEAWLSLHPALTRTPPDEPLAENDLDDAFGAKPARAAR